VIQFRSPNKGLFCFPLVFVLLLSSCSGGSSTGGDGEVGSPSQLAGALIRASGEQETITSYWRCENSDYTVSHFAFSNFDNRNTAHTWLASQPLPDANIEHGWQVIAGDEVQLITNNGEMFDTLSYIVFSTESAFSAMSDRHDYISCTYHHADEILAIEQGALVPDIALADEPMLPVGAPSGFIALYDRFKFTTIDGVYQPIRDVDAIFDDGQIPTSIEQVFKYGPSVFRRDFYYRLEGSGTVKTLVLNSQLDDWSGAGRFEATALRAGSTDEKLNGCFTRNNRFLYSDFGQEILTGPFGIWCFRPDGRFTIHIGDDFDSLSETPFQQTPNNAGRYRVDGYGIRLFFDNGFQRKSGFGWIVDTPNLVYLMGGYPTLE
jgi:hypothetical protein